MSSRESRVVTLSRNWFGSSVAAKSIETEGETIIARISSDTTSTDSRISVPRSPRSSGRTHFGLQRRELREVRTDHRTDGAPSAPLGGRNHRDRRDHSDDEPQETLQGPENPQRPYAGPLRRQFEEDEMVRSSRRRGEAGERQSASRGRAASSGHQVTESAKFLVG